MSFACMCKCIYMHHMYLHVYVYKQMYVPQRIRQEGMRVLEGFLIICDELDLLLFLEIQINTLEVVHLYCRACKGFRKGMFCNHNCICMYVCM
jgi:hypothetical protein